MPAPTESLCQLLPVEAATLWPEIEREKRQIKRSTSSTVIASLPVEVTVQKQEPSFSLFHFSALTGNC